MNNKNKKISIVGVGNVGAIIAYTLTIYGIANEIVLIDTNLNRAKGEAMDISQMKPLTHNVNIYAGDYLSVVDSDIIIISAGLKRKPNQVRMDLAKINIGIVKEIIPQLLKYASNAVFLVVSNPVDIITYAVTKFSGLPYSQIVGSGTILDTMRLRTSLAEHVSLAPQNIHAYVVGEHGDASIIPWSLVYIAGIQMERYCENNCNQYNICGKSKLQNIIDYVKTSGTKIIAYKGATYYTISLSVCKLCDSILRNDKEIFTVSSMLQGQYGVDNVCASLPFVTNKQGILHALDISMTEHEINEFYNSATAIKDALRLLKI